MQDGLISGVRYPVSGLRGCLVGAACCFAPVLLVVPGAAQIATVAVRSGGEAAALAVAFAPFAAAPGYVLWRAWRRALCATDAIDHSGGRK